jgi:hypothetical protein
MQLVPASPQALNSTTQSDTVPPKLLNRTTCLLCPLLEPFPVPTHLSCVFTDLVLEVSWLHPMLHVVLLLLPEYVLVILGPISKGLGP